MPFSRRILHHGSNPNGVPVLLDDRAIQNCWFELHRQGGCGTGELQLHDKFPIRQDIEPGDWISLEASPGNRWYLGRVEEIRTASPAGSRLRLEGMSVQLNEVFPGGFGLQADGAAPHRYAATDLFVNDPDHQQETVDFAQNVEQLVHLLLTQYVTTATHIQYLASRIEAPVFPAPITSLKFRGEETVRTVFKDLAMRAQGASWGVDAAGQFFFLRPRDTVQSTWREGRDLVSLTETRDRENLYNRLLLTGDYIYDRKEESQAIARRTYRWRGNFIQSQSRQQFGERRLRLWIPWIRTQADSQSFAREFFRTYARPTARYLIETIPQETLLVPWHGRVALEDQHGQLLATARLETVRIFFDHQPRCRMELGPEDPRQLWPEPPQDERWETPEDIQQVGGSVSQLDSYQNSDPPSNSTLPTNSTRTSLTTSDQSSNPSFDTSSNRSSDDSSNWSSENSSAWYSSNWTSSLLPPNSSGTSSASDTSLGTSGSVGSTSTYDSSSLMTSAESTGISLTTSGNATESSLPLTSQSGTTSDTDSLTLSGDSLSSNLTLVSTGLSAETTSDSEFTSDMQSSSEDNSNSSVIGSTTSNSNWTGNSSTRGICTSSSYGSSQTYLGTSTSSTGYETSPTATTQGVSTGSSSYENSSETNSGVWTSAWYNV